MSKEYTISSAIAEIQTKYGKGSIMKLGERANNEIEVIPTGCLSLDTALGVGGFPRGRIIEIYGPESSGKTTLALHVVASAQKMGGVAAYVDSEHALDPAYAEALGVDINEMLISQPDSGEQALEIVETLARSDEVAVIIVDSVAALIPQAEINGEMGDAQMGNHAKLMSQAMRKLKGVVSTSNTCLIFINQIRMKIGIVFGNPETTTGGMALRYYASMRVDIRRTGAIKDGDEFTGNRTKVKIVKNKVAPPFKVTEFDIMYGKGISKASDVLDLAIQHKIIDQKGSWFSMGEEKLGQGRDNLKKRLEEDTDFYSMIESLVKEKLVK